MRQQRLCIQNPPGPCPLRLFIWLVLISIIYISIALSWVLWIFLANYRTQGGVLRTPEFVCSWKEMYETWGSLKCSRCLKWGYSGGRPCAPTCGVWHRCNQVVSVTTALRYTSWWPSSCSETLSLTEKKTMIKIIAKIERSSGVALRGTEDN